MKKLVTLSLFVFTSAFSVNTREMIGQLLICPIHGNKVTREISEFIDETKIGGVILYNWAENLDDLDQLKSFIDDLQKLSTHACGLPLFVSIDQEGGRVQRINMNIPSAEKMGQEGFSYVFDCSNSIGSKLNSLGINLNFAPVVDINSNKDNLIINDRAFGKDPILVTKLARSFIHGLQSNNIFPCIKHFPGHGDTSEDSHYTTPTSNKSLKELLATELVPFQHLIKDIPFIMTSHILFKNIDPKNPVTLSSIFLKEILRKLFGYQNIIITDSLRMEGLNSYGQNLSEIAIKALNAGNDLLLVGGNRLIETDPNASFLNLFQVKKLYHDLVDALDSELIDKQEIKASIVRILKQKKQLGKRMIHE